MNLLLAYRRRLAAAVLAAVALLAGCNTLDSQQRRWIFQPTAEPWRGGLLGIEGMEDVWIEFESRQSGEPVRLHALWHPHPDAAAPVLLYLHGARWGVTGSLNRVRRMQSLGFSVLVIDYRGFGLSSAALPSEAYAHEDSLAAWQWLAKHHPERPRYLFGHSLGGAIATRLAAEADDVQGLMVEASFPSVREVVATMRYGWLPVGWLITQRFEAGEHIRRVKAPVLVVHGSEDRLIPPELGRALYERAPGPKRWVLVEGGTHHSTNAVGQAQYEAALRELFAWPR